MFSKPVHETIANPSDIARPHDDQYIARSQMRLEKLLDIYKGVQVRHILPQGPGPRGEIRSRNLARLGGALAARKMSAINTLSAFCRLKASSSSSRAVRNAWWG